MNTRQKNILQGIKNDDERLANAYAAFEELIEKGNKKNYWERGFARISHFLFLKLAWAHGWSVNHS